MKIIKKGDLTILFPEDGYELISKNTGIRSDKVYMSKLDSADNYVEVMKQGYVAGLKDLRDKSDMEMLLLMETIDSLIMLLEPVLMSLPFSVKETSNNPIEKIAVFYTEMVKRGLKDLEDIPLSLKELVSANLNK
jgi:hypothetical protein